MSCPCLHLGINAWRIPWTIAHFFVRSIVEIEMACTHSHYLQGANIFGFLMSILVTGEVSTQPPREQLRDAPAGTSLKAKGEKVAVCFVGMQKGT